MPLFLILLIYNVLLPVVVLIGFPAWVIKMWKRGGYGTGLMQRLAVYNVSPESEPKGVVYIHAVSVGEVLIALKLINKWLEIHPEEKFVLAATTATGHEVARKKAAGNLRVIYSPLDFGFIVRSVFRRFKPQQIILVEAEVWPNFVRLAQKKAMPVSIINARLSQRSEARFQKLAMWVKPIFAMLDAVHTQNGEDGERFAKLGIDREKIHITGSLKFDPEGGSLPAKRDEFQEILDAFGVGRKVVLAVSTHIGEEKLIGEAFLKSEAAEKALLVIAPRHSERRDDVLGDMQSLGFEPILKTSFRPSASAEKACLIIDTTGELRDWTAHADLAIIGKSFLGKGGQNPVEAIIAGVPVICGEYMGNFEPLITQLRESGGVLSVRSEEELSVEIGRLLSDLEKSSNITAKGQEIVTKHKGAVVKAVKTLYLNKDVDMINTGNNSEHE